MHMYEPYLAHYGVKGMKWGVRRKRNEYNKNYTDKQRKQDRAVYGRGAERRINRRMNEGYGVRGARAYEADRKERKDRRKSKARKVRKVVTGTAVSIGSAWITDQIFNQGRNTKLVMDFGKTAINTGMDFVNTVTGRKSKQILDEMLRNARRR